MQAFLFAISFLTRLPVPFQIKYNNLIPANSFSFFTLVGLIIGIILVLFDLLFSYFLPTTVTGILLLIILVYLTGAIHLDGFMDSVDGLFSCRNKDRVQEIMHDSLTGAFAVIAVILLLLLKFVLFIELKGTIRIPILLLMPAISRWLVVFAAFRYPVTTSSKIGKGFKYDLKPKQLVVNTVILFIAVSMVTVLFDINLLYAVFLFLFSWLVIVLICRQVIKKIDGLTGDVYGAINEVAEVIVLLLGLILYK